MMPISKKNENNYYCQLYQKVKAVKQFEYNMIQAQCGIEICKFQITLYAKSYTCGTGWIQTELKNRK